MIQKLNLVNLEDSDIKYKVSRFPDGQQSITLDMIDFDLAEKIDQLLST